MRSLFPGDCEALTKRYVTKPERTIVLGPNHYSDYFRSYYSTRSELRNRQSRWQCPNEEYKSRQISQSPGHYTAEQLSRSHRLWSAAFLRQLMHVPIHFAQRELQEHASIFPIRSRFASTALPANKHRAPSQHVRDYPRAISGDEADLLYLAVRQYMPRDKPTPPRALLAEWRAAHTNAIPPVSVVCGGSSLTCLTKLRKYMSLPVDMVRREL